MYTYVAVITENHFIGFLRIRRTTHITYDIFIILNAKALLIFQYDLYLLPTTNLNSKIKQNVFNIFVLTLWLLICVPLALRLLAQIEFHLLKKRQNVRDRHCIFLTMLHPLGQYHRRMCFLLKQPHS